MRADHSFELQQLLLYTTKVLVGQPPQSITLLVDTGSAQLSIMDGKSAFCTTDPINIKECAKFGAYHSGDSHTFKPIDNGFFDTVFVDEGHVSGVHATETMIFNDLTFENYVFDFGLDTNTAHNTLGIGYARKQANNNIYPTLPERLVGMGRIKLNAYSVWLNSLEATSGLILYGGIDTAKIDGKLQTLPVYGLTKVPGDTSVRELTVRLNDVTFGQFRCPTSRALLDTGSTYSYLPPSFVLPILKSLNAIQDPQYLDTNFVDCGLRNYNTPFVFTFGIGSDLVTIRVPMSSMVFDDKEFGTLEKDGVRLCRFGLDVMKQDEDIATLGDTFLRSSYAVYDLTNHQISLAQASYSLASSLLEIPKDGVSAMGLTNS